MNLKSIFQEHVKVFQCVKYYSTKNTQCNMDYSSMKTAFDDDLIDECMEFPQLTRTTTNHMEDTNTYRKGESEPQNLKCYLEEHLKLTTDECKQTDDDYLFKNLVDELKRESATSTCVQKIKDSNRFKGICCVYLLERCMKSNCSLYILK